MTLARIVVTGKVIKNPEKRFSQSNLAVTSLIIDINPQEETIVRVVAVGKAADNAADNISMGDSVIVDGRLQMETIKTPSGRDRKVATISASSIEKISAGNNAQAPLQNQNTQNSKEPLVQFSTEEISEDLIDPEEIPF